MLVDIAGLTICGMAILMRLSNAPATAASTMVTIAPVTIFPSARLWNVTTTLRTVGIHPHDAANGPRSDETTAELAQQTKVIGIGETGLDYWP